MSEIKQRVAKVIKEAFITENIESGPAMYETIAHKAIEAMLEPTEEMIRASCNKVLDRTLDLKYGVRDVVRIFKDTWQVAIKEALNDQDR